MNPLLVTIKLRWINLLHPSHDKSHPRIAPVAPSHHRYKEVTAVRVRVDVSLHRASEAECVTAENLVTGAFEGSSRTQRLNY